MPLSTSKGTRPGMMSNRDGQARWSPPRLHCQSLASQPSYNSRSLYRAGILCSMVIQYNMSHRIQDSVEVYTPQPRQSFLISLCVSLPLALSPLCSPRPASAIRARAGLALLRDFWAESRGNESLTPTNLDRPTHASFFSCFSPPFSSKLFAYCVYTNFDCCPLS